MAKLSLKTQNIAPLSMLILFQCALAYILSAGNVEALNEKWISPSSSVLLLVGVLSGWFSYLLPVSVKSSLVFLRLNNALPGHRFIQLSEHDPRIDNGLLRASIPDSSELSVDPIRQNQYWYKNIYRPNVDDREVSSAHKAYLLYRDAATVSAIFIVFLIVASVFVPMVKAVTSVRFLMVMVGCFIGFLVAANIAGKRFVTTAVAIYLVGVAGRDTAKNVSE